MSRPLPKASRATLWRRLAPAAASGIALLFPGVARAEPHELRSDVRVDAAIALGLASAAVTLTATEGGFAPSRCRWCDEDGAGKDTRNAADRGARAALVRQNAGIAARVSDIYGLALLPASMVGMTILAAVDERALDGTPVDLLIVTEAVGLAVTTTQITKFIALRQRPDSMQVVGQDDQRIGLPWMKFTNAAYRSDQRIRVVNQQRRAPIPQRHGEKVSTAWDEVATIVHHARLPSAERGTRLRAAGLLATCYVR